MKFNNICVFIAVIFMFFSCGDYKPDKLPSSNQKKSQDQVEELPQDMEDDEELTMTLPWNPDSVRVIFEGGTEDDRQFVFIPSSNQEEYLSFINDFSMPTKFETSMYRSTFSDIIKKSELEDSVVISDDFPKEWLTVNWYDDDYYLYCPSRIEMNYRVRVTDSSLMIFNEHGVNAEVITWFEQVQKNMASFITRAIGINDNVFTKEINIYYIDESPLVAVWEEFSPNGVNYRLMIPAKDCYDYSIIVNYGEKSKPNEFKFETVNYYEEILMIVGGN